mgnify:CR=1 FL=1
MPDISIQLGKLTLKNPVIAASGPWGYGLEYAEICPPEKLGAFISKGLSLKSRKGNPPPRICETPCGMLNAIGLQNIGVEVFLQRKLPLLAERGTTVIANFFGSSVEEYAKVAEMLGSAKDISALEVNISCPNVRGREGKFFGSTPERAFEITQVCRKATDKFLIIKLTPETRDITEIAKAVESAGADAITLINTFPAMSIDIRTRKPKLGNITGGLSGPAIKPIVVRMIWETAKVVRIPILGSGGVMTEEDAIEMIVAGAHAVQVGTVIFHDPSAPLKIIEGIKKFMRGEGISSLNELRGSVIMDK